MINVVQGSIFDKRCDLLVVPCDDLGGVTSPVFSNLQARGLPTNAGRLQHGRVHFREVQYEFASTIAYAASVGAAATVAANMRAVTSIAHEILTHSCRNKVRSVNLPLLGSGAGGLTPVQSYRSLRATLAAEETVEFSIYCYTQDAYRLVIASHRNMSPASSWTKHPRVFVSYTGRDKENAHWVRRLATALRANGIDARLDVFHLRPGLDLPQWMANEVTLADKVLLICDRFYMERADVKTGGVGWETMIIQGDMLTRGENARKYVAILREEKADEALPAYLRSKYAFHWGPGHKIESAKLKELLLCLFDCEIAPELGAVPDYVLDTLFIKQTRE